MDQTDLIRLREFDNHKSVVKIEDRKAGLKDEMGTATIFF